MNAVEKEKSLLDGIFVAQRVTLESFIVSYIRPFFIGVSFSASAVAHHSPNLHFDRNEVTEVSGEISEVAWRNPHTEITVLATDEDGEEILWLVDARGASQFLRAGLDEDMFRVGEHIQVAGFRGRRNRNAVFSTNILLADGRELVADNFAQPRWAADRVVNLVTRDPTPISTEDLPSNGEGIFRVWGRDRSNYGIQGTGRSLWKDSYPLTEQAQVAQASWDRVADNPYIRCETGMPAIMDLGTPMQFVQEGGDIVLYLEEQDSVRRIHMTSDTAPIDGNRTSMGYSVGHWENETLVVVTTSVNWPWFDQSGVSQTELVEFIERFTPNSDGSILNYTVTVTDSNIFTEPVLLERHWVWEPNEELRPYNCVWERNDL
ncbi:MAG: DUF6152 family protein [Pseudomonadota bacterium]|nr:DUF6152 family protein [Pseudomonadota bacterium]